MIMVIEDDHLESMTWNWPYKEERKINVLICTLYLYTNLTYTIVMYQVMGCCYSNL